MLKRFSIAFALVALLSLAFAGAAFANFGPHGGYVDDTDACAGCHRAHTSFSTVGWTDKSGTYGGNALLVGGYTNTTEFCNACHGDLAPGASTNVVSGVFDSGPSGSSTQVVGVLGDSNGVTDGGDDVVIAYSTESTFNAPLNGGGFSTMPNPYTWEASATVAYKNATSAHSMEQVGPLWGAGNALSTTTLTCTSCHDPHGTSNYRLLKGSVNGQTVGGYEADGETPNTFVISGEQGFPLSNALGGSYAQNGFLKHEAGASQMSTYFPDYTTPRYATFADGITAEKSMSVWCSGCHTGYNDRSSAANYGAYEGGGGVGTQTRHRHPVDMPVTAGKPVAGQSLNEAVLFDQYWIPLEENLSGSGDPYQNVVGCLTCHRAHGSSADMTGWAAAHLEQSGTNWIPVRDNIAGVDPDKAGGVAGVPGGTVPVGSSALLRADNRGVCERCHNK